MINTRSFLSRVGVPKFFTDVLFPHTLLQDRISSPIDVPGDVYISNPSLEKEVLDAISGDTNVINILCMPPRTGASTVVKRVVNEYLSPTRIGDCRGKCTNENPNLGGVSYANHNPTLLGSVGIFGTFATKYDVDDFVTDVVDLEKKKGILIVDHIKERSMATPYGRGSRALIRPGGNYDFNATILLVTDSPVVVERIISRNFHLRPPELAEKCGRVGINVISNSGVPTDAQIRECIFKENVVEPLLASYALEAQSYGYIKDCVRILKLNEKVPDHRKLIKDHTQLINFLATRRNTVVANRISWECEMKRLVL